MFGLPEDVVYDTETCSSNISLYFCVQCAIVGAANELHCNVAVQKPVDSQMLLLVASDSKVNVKFTLEQATKLQRGSRGIALLFL